MLTALLHATEHQRWADADDVKAHLELPMATASTTTTLRALAKDGLVVKGSSRSGLWRRP